MKETPENYKEEKYYIQEKNVKFFTVGKLIKLLFLIFFGFLSLIGFALILNVTILPEMGMVELVVNIKNKTNIWLDAKKTDLAHEAIAFEKMLDAYALKGGDISHSLDTLTDEFTAANWAELLEYDVDYFLSHSEINDSIKVSGMVHISRLLYTSGHYDLFKQAFRILMDRFASPEDYPLIFNQFLPMKADFDFDDEEERQELEVLYELELRRHLRIIARETTLAINDNQISSNALLQFIEDLKGTLQKEQDIFDTKGERFKDQVESDLVNILTLIKERADDENNVALKHAGYGLIEIMNRSNLKSAAKIAQLFM